MTCGPKCLPNDFYLQPSTLFRKDIRSQIKTNTDFHSVGTTWRDNAKHHKPGNGTKTD